MPPCLDPKIAQLQCKTCAKVKCHGGVSNNDIIVSQLGYAMLAGLHVFLLTGELRDIGFVVTKCSQRPQKVCLYSNNEHAFSSDMQQTFLI